MTEMKHENSTNNTAIDNGNVLAIWIGQLLVFALKSDMHDLVLLRKDFSERVFSLLETNSSAHINEALANSSACLCHLMGQRFSWVPEAENLLTEKITRFCIEFISSKDVTESLSALRVIDSWSGLASCLSEKLPMPLSLLDYTLEIILPILSDKLIPDLCNEIDSLFVGDSVPEIAIIEQKLNQIVKRICFNSELDKSPTAELSLAILMHLPKDNKDFSMKTGYIYKLLQTKFAQKEIR